MRKEEIVELSHRIVPGKEHFKIEIKVDDVSKILPEITHKPDIWYVLGEMNCSSHVGTHIEMPYHHWKEGLDVADYPFYKLIGDCVVLDFTHKKKDEPITLTEVKKYDDLIKKNDIVFIRTGMDKYYRTPRWEETPYLTEEATLWFVVKEVACLGTDSAVLEVPHTDHQPNHENLFKAGIPFIESLTNLDKIKNKEYLVVILPLPVEGLDASPVRIAAIRKRGLK